MQTFMIGLFKTISIPNTFNLCNLYLKQTKQNYLKKKFDHKFILFLQIKHILENRSLYSSCYFFLNGCNEDLELSA